MEPAPDARPIVTLIHATPAAIPPVVEALSKIRPIRILNQLDEGLLAEIERYGGLTQECIDRMTTQLDLAKRAGSSVILTTCNAYSIALLTRLRPAMPDPPIVIIDEPMIRRSLSYQSVAVIATVRAGLESQQELIQVLDAQRTDHGGTQVSYRLREDAFASLTAGDAAAHDRIVTAEIQRALETNDVVVLAQASIARVVDSLPVGIRERVLASPQSAAQEVDRLLDRVEEDTV